MGRSGATISVVDPAAERLYVLTLSCPDTTGIVARISTFLAGAGGWITEAGYTGDIEVEIFNQAIWDTPGDEVLRIMKDRYLRHVLPGLAGAAG